MKILTTIICLLAISQINAQSLSRQVISSTGIAIQNSSAGLSSTLGEVITSSHINSTVHLTQGFQQSDESETISIIKLSEAMFSVTVFPNPTTKLLNIKSDLATKGINQLSYQIIDATGKLVHSGTIYGDNNTIDVGELAKASYILRLTNPQHQINQIIRFNKM